MDFVVLSAPYPFLNSLEELFAQNVQLDALQGATKIRSLHVSQLEVKNNHEWLCLSTANKLIVNGLPVSISDIDLGNLGALGNLTMLHFSIESLFPSSCLPRGLSKLHLSGPKILRHQFLVDLPPRLLSLSLYMTELLVGKDQHKQVQSLTNRGISILPRSIVTLSISPAHELTDEAIMSLPPHLTRVSLYPCPNLTDACVPHFPRRMAAIHLSGCPGITNAAIKHLPRELSMFKVGSNNQFTDECLPDKPPLVTQLGSKKQDRVDHELLLIPSTEA
jgi:hypothetical protein